MPKISTAGGASYEPVTEDQYNASVQRTKDGVGTEEDRLLIERYEWTRDRDQNVDDVEASDEDGVSSDGTSSSNSDDKPGSSNEPKLTASQKRAPTTGNRSDKVQVGSSTAGSTGGSTRATGHNSK